MALPTDGLCIVCCKVLKITEYCVVNEVCKKNKAKTEISSHDSHSQI